MQAYLPWRSCAGLSEKEAKERKKECPAGLRDEEVRTGPLDQQAIRVHDAGAADADRGLDNSVAL